ncbi:MAG: histidinol-phosphatase HisJ family protein [Bacteroidales bacterium]|nr:histidinol-phosphatase HisJ family protein [Bacteroidales bacterium]
MSNKTRAKLVDTHSHSSFSPDSNMSLEQAAVAAYTAGLEAFAVTDHLDLKAPGGDTRFAFDPAEQQQEIDIVQKGTQVKILKGVEIGLQPENLSDIRTFLKDHTFDTVIASIHFVDGVDPYYGVYYEGKQEMQAYERYLEVMLQMIEEYPDFDILGHYDYIARYAPYSKRTILYKDHPDIFDSIFRFLEYNGKALEINTNTYRERNGKSPVLDPDVLKRYAELGGELLTIGSDAHTPERFGENFHQYLATAQKCGIKYISFFEKRKAVPRKIETFL